MKKTHILTLAAAASVAAFGAAAQQAAPGDTMMKDMPAACQEHMKSMPAECRKMMMDMKTGGDHAMMNMPAKGDKGASSTAFREANTRMHSGMDITFSGDADADFVKGMLPHHQGAVDMAKVELKFGKDPDNRKLAEAIIAAQEVEIAQMQAWLKAHGQ